jgi:hypothetical protein
MSKNPLLIAAVASTLFLVSTAAAEDIPPRKAGLWEMETSMPGMPQKMPSAKQCIDGTTDNMMRDMSQVGGGTTCSKKETKKEGESYVTDSVCSMNGTTITSHTITSGDFTKSYHVESASTMNPPLMGRSETKIAVDAKYLGDCEAGQKPGDIIMSTGQKMNIADLKNMTKGMAGPARQ